MKCPILCICAAINNKRHPIEAADCLKEECAVWNRNEAECPILTVARDLAVIKAILYEAVKKMPHAGQFTK